MTRTNRRRVVTYTLFTSPAIILFILFLLIPFVNAIRYSFLNWNGIDSQVHWIGWDNYRKVFADGAFRKACLFTVKLVLGTTVLLNALGLLLALALNMALKTKNLLRTAFFLPSVIGSILVGYLWQYIIVYLIPEIGKMVGAGFLQKNWISLPDYSLASIFIVFIWQYVGYYMIIYLSALQGIPKDLLEAASIDGAGGWARFRSVTLVTLRPAIIIGLFLAVSGGFKSFDLNYSLTQGGPFGTTESLSLQIYKDAFTSNAFSYASAKAVLFVTILSVVTLVQVAAMKRKEVEL